MATFQPPLYRLTRISVPALLFVAFFNGTNAEPTQSVAAVAPPTNVVLTIVVGESAPVAPSVGAATLTGTDISWNDIKDYTMEMRSQFLAGLQRMEARLSIQYSELTAKRAAVKSTTSAKNLDQALNELSSAQFFLKTMGELLSRTTPQAWEQQKAKVGLVWMKSQEAYFKGKNHPTS